MYICREVSLTLESMDDPGINYNKSMIRAKRMNHTCGVRFPARAKIEPPIVRRSMLLVGDAFGGRIPGNGDY